MSKLNKNNLGLVVGIFAAVMHAVWALMVLAKVGQAIMDWVFPLHFIDNLYQVTAFTITNALILVVMGFVGGYIMGWLFALVWNWINKK